MGYFFYFVSWSGYTSGKKIFIVCEYTMAIGSFNPSSDEHDKVIDIHVDDGTSGLSGHDKEINDWIEGEFKESLGEIITFLDQNHDIDDYFAQEDVFNEMIQETKLNIEKTADDIDNAQGVSYKEWENLQIELTAEGVKDVLKGVDGNMASVESVKNTIKSLPPDDQRRIVQGVVSTYMSQLDTTNVHREYFADQIVALCQQSSVKIRTVNGDIIRDEIIGIGDLKQFLLDNAQAYYFNNVILNDSIDISTIVLRTSDTQYIPPNGPGAGGCWRDSGIRSGSSSLNSDISSTDNYSCGGCTPEERERAIYEIHNQKVAYDSYTYLCLDDDSMLESDVEEDHDVESVYRLVYDYTTEMIGSRASGKDLKALTRLRKALTRVKGKNKKLQVFTVVALIMEKYDSGAFVPGGARLESKTWETRGDDAGLDMNGNGLFHKKDSKLLRDLAKDYLNIVTDASGYPHAKTAWGVLARHLSAIGFYDNPDNIARSNRINDDEGTIARLYNQKNDLTGDITLDENYKLIHKWKKSIRKWAERGEKRAMMRILKAYKKGKLTASAVHQLKVKYGNKPDTFPTHSWERDVLLDDNTKPHVQQLVEALLVGMEPDDAYRAWVLANQAHINSKKLEANGITDHTRQHTHTAIQFISDRNLDGKVTFEDGDIKTGLMFHSLFDSAVSEMLYRENNSGPYTEQQKKIAEDKIICNLVDFVSWQAQLEGIYPDDLHEVFDTIDKLDTGSDLRLAFQAHPALIGLFQKTLLHSPLPLSYIMMHGNDAMARWQENVHNSMKQQLNLSEKDKKLLDARFAIEWKKMQARASEMGVTLDASMQEQFKYQFIGVVTGLAQNMHPTTTVGAGGVNFSQRLATLLDGTGRIDFNLVVGMGGNVDGDNVGGLLGMSISYEQDLGSGWTLSSSLGGGSTVTPGRVTMFAPIAHIGVSKSFDLNSNKLKNNVLGGGSSYSLNLSTGVVVLPLMGAIGYGGTIGIKRDRLKGINTKYKSLHTRLHGVIDKILGDKEIKRNSLDGMDGKLPTKHDDVITYNISRILLHFPSDRGGTREEREQAATSLYRELLYFRQDGMLSAGLTKSMIADTVADFYATERRNKEMMGLNKRGIEDASIGLHVFISVATGGFPMLMGSAFVGFSKYKYMAWENSEISKQKNAVAELNGVGNFKVQAENYVTPSDIEYINHRMDSLWFQYKHISMNGSVGHKIDVDDVILEGDHVKIPESVRENGLLNVKLSKEMKGYVLRETDDNGTRYLVFDKHVPMRFMEINGVQGTEFILNIGDVDTDPGDAHLLRGRGMDFYHGWIGTADLPPSLQTSTEEKITPKSINAAIHAMGSSFPLQHAEETSDKRGYYKITLQSGVSITVPSGSRLKVKNGALYIPQGYAKKLTFEKSSSGYTIKEEDAGELEFVYTSSDKKITQALLDSRFNSDANFSDLHFSTTDGKVVTVTYNGKTENYTLPGTLTVTEKTSGAYTFAFKKGGKGFTVKMTKLETFPGGKVVDKQFVSDVSLSTYDAISKIEGDLDGKIDSIDELENTYPDDFKTFMQALAQLDRDVNVSEEKLNIAIGSLSSMLRKFDKSSSAIDLALTLKKIQSLGSYDDKLQVCLYFRSLFSLEDSYEGKTLKSLYKVRKNQYIYATNLAGKRCPINVRDKLMISDSTSFFRSSHSIDSTIIGMTAFYRKSYGYDYARRGMTTLGATKVFNGSLVDITDNNNKLRDWFIESIKASPFAMKSLRISLEKKLPDSLNGTISSLSNENIIELLKGNSIGGEAKLILQGNFVAYLCGDCANESVGFKITGWQWIEKSNGNDVRPKQVTQSVGTNETHRKVVGKDQVATGKGGLWFNTRDGMAVNFYEKKDEIRFGVGVGIGEGDNTGSNPNDNNDGKTGSHPRDGNSPGGSN